MYRKSMTSNKEKKALSKRNFRRKKSDKVMVIID